MMGAFFSTTLSRYLAKTYFFYFIGLLAILLGVVFLFDAIELLRRATKHDDVAASIILQMAFLKLPDMALMMAPFAVLFSGLYTFWQLAKRQELVTLRAAGISVWQFLSPILMVVVVMGVVMVGVINPLSATLYGRYMALERHYLDRDGSSVIAVFNQGLWLRQDLQSDGGYALIHAETVDADWRLRDVLVLSFDKDNRFRQRMNADTATLKDSHWNLRQTLTFESGVRAEPKDLIRIPTHLTTRDIEESFSSPQAMGFWGMASFIRTLESTGFDSTRVRIHFQSLLAQPFLYMAMVIVAACVALRQQRQGQTFLFVIIGVTTGFAVFLMSNFMQALGSSHQLPVFLAAWSPTLIAGLLGVSVLLVIEDG